MAKHSCVLPGLSTGSVPSSDCISVLIHLSFPLKYLPLLSSASWLGWRAQPSVPHHWRASQSCSLSGGIPKLLPVRSGGQRLFRFYQQRDFCSSTTACFLDSKYSERMSPSFEGSCLSVTVLVPKPRCSCSKALAPATPVNIRSRNVLPQPNSPYSIVVNAFIFPNCSSSSKTMIKRGVWWSRSVNRCPSPRERGAARCQNPSPSHILGRKAYVWGWLQERRATRLGSYFPLLLCSSVHLHFDFSGCAQLCKTKETTEAPPAKDRPRFRNAVVVKRQ